MYWKPLFVGKNLDPLLGTPFLLLVSLLSLTLSNDSCMIGGPSHHASLSVPPMRLTHKPLLHHEVLEPGRGI